MAYKARYQERNGSWKTKKTTVISYTNFNLSSSNDLTMSKQNQKYQKTALFPRIRLDTV